MLGRAAHRPAAVQRDVRGVCAGREDPLRDPASRCTLNFCFCFDFSVVFFWCCCCCCCGCCWCCWCWWWWWWWWWCVLVDVVEKIRFVFRPPDVHVRMCGHLIVARLILSVGTQPPDGRLPGRPDFRAAPHPTDRVWRPWPALKAGQGRPGLRRGRGTACSTSFWGQFPRISQL